MIAASRSEVLRHRKELGMGTARAVGTKCQVISGTMQGTEPQQQTPNAPDWMLSTCLHQAFGCSILVFFPCCSKIHLVWLVMASWGGDCSHQRGTFGLCQHKGVSLILANAQLAELMRMEEQCSVERGQGTDGCHKIISQAGRDS